MKKIISIVSIIFLSLLVGVTMTNSVQTASADYLPSSPFRVKSRSIDPKDSGTFTNDYYRLIQKAKATVTYTVKGTYGKQVKRTMTMPKGTIVAGKFGYVDKKHIYPGPAGLSYYLQRKTMSSHYYGLINGQGRLSFKIAYTPSRIVRIKRPAYAMPFGNGILLSGGLAALKQINNPDYQSNAVKITSDGYLEYYPSNHQTYKWRYQQKTSGGSSIMTGTNRTNFDMRPQAYAKINKAVKKGATVYLYTNKKVDGTNQKQVKKSGAYKYRLAVRNLHTPYWMTNYGANDDGSAASLYMVGSKPYYTEIAQAFN